MQTSRDLCHLLLTVRTDHLLAVNVTTGSRPATENTCRFIPNSHSTEGKIKALNTCNKNYLQQQSVTRLIAGEHLSSISPNAAGSCLLAADAAGGCTDDGAGLRLTPRELFAVLFDGRSNWREATS